MKLLKTSRTALIHSVLALVVSLFSFAVVAPAATHATSADSQTKSQNHKKPKITHKKVTKTEVIKFSTKTQNDTTLPQGQTKIAQTGINGQKKVTYKVTYANGKATKWKAVFTKVIKQPKPQITIIGTYVAPAPAPKPVATPASQPSCTNGSYVNSAGNTVCSPETTSSAPAGATARCVDGTYSFSQTHSGTCSHHGGVSSWL